MIQPTNLKTEYLINPLGIDIVQPRLFWNVTDAIRQTAYQIVATVDGTTIWDSGKVASGSMRATYAGEPLRSRQRVVWTVTLWDEHDNAGASATAWFEMGLLDARDWVGAWISADLNINKKERYPVDHFKRTFTLTQPLKRARLYITACGLYEAALNGATVGDAVLTPGYTDYRERVQYQTYDVTDQLHQGDNTLTVALADGWYRGEVGALSYRNVFGTRTKLQCQLEVVYGDGSTATVCSDTQFAWSNDGAIRYADMKNGERVDARLSPGYGGRARLTTHPVIPTAANNVLIKQRERFTPTLLHSPTGKTILDFGQNIAGFVEMRVQGRAGQTITLQMGEVLDHGEFTRQNFQATRRHLIAQQVDFVCSGGADFYRTRFAIFGFRYVLVEGLATVNPSDFVAIAVYSALEETGTFTCSHPLVNRLVKNTLWSMKGNFADVPTDCPTRERAGWTGDMQIFTNTANYLMNAAPFIRKWLLDLSDRQTEDGKAHVIVPSVGEVWTLARMDGCVGWADASIFVPYRCYQMYGDSEFIRRAYPSMKAFAEFSIRRAARTYFANWFKKNPYKKYTYDTEQHFGEWLEPEGVEPGNMYLNITFPRPEEATAYFHYQMSMMRDAAAALGFAADSARYADYADGSRKAYNYLIVRNGTIDSDRQAKLVRPLALGLLEGAVKRNVEDRLEQALRDNDWRIGTGFLSTPFILPVLTAAGKLDVAFKVLENEAVPGWLYATKHGATTIWETWEGFDQDGKPKESHNHYAFGAVCEWLFDTVGGIRVAAENHFVIAPHYGGSLQFAETVYSSVFGEVATRWALRGEQFVLRVTVPGNCSAEIRLPDGTTYHVESGNHQFACPALKDTD